MESSTSCGRVSVSPTVAATVGVQLPVADRESTTMLASEDASVLELPREVFTAA